MKFIKKFITWAELLSLAYSTFPDADWPQLIAQSVERFEKALANGTHKWWKIYKIFDNPTM